MDELKQKIQSIYEIFIGFLIVDWDMEEIEIDALFLEFFDCLRLFFPQITKPEVNFEETIKRIAENSDNFINNANFLNSTISKDEKIWVLWAISQIIFSDWDFSDYEYELFNKLMIAWEITKEDLK